MNSSTVKSSLRQSAFRFLILIGRQLMFIIINKEFLWKDGGVDCYTGTWTRDARVFFGSTGSTTMASCSTSVHTLCWSLVRASTVQSSLNCLFLSISILYELCITKLGLRLILSALSALSKAHWFLSRRVDFFYLTICTFDVKRERSRSARAEIVLC